MELRVCFHISEKKAHLYTIGILHESLTFACSDGTQHSRELGLFHGPTTKKRLPTRKKVDFSHYLTKMVQTLPAVRFQNSINKHKLNRMKIKSGINRSRNG